MGYKALITLDLPSATEIQRDNFYEYLKQEKWNKIKNLTTAWKATFNDDVSRESAVRVLETDLRNAKNKSRVSKVEYVIQLDLNELIINTI